MTRQQEERVSAYLAALPDNDAYSPGFRRLYSTNEHVRTVVASVLAVAISSMSSKFWEPALFFDEEDDDVEVVFQARGARVELNFSTHGKAYGPECFRVYRIGGETPGIVASFDFPDFPAEELASALRWLTEEVVA